METATTAPEEPARGRGGLWVHLLTGVSAAGAAAALVLIHGFSGFAASPVLRFLAGAAAAGLVGQLALRWGRDRWRWGFLREEIAEVLPAGLLLPALSAALLWAPPAGMRVVEAYLGAALLAQVVRLYRAAHEANLGPAHLLVLSWLGAIAVGTGLLSLPRATASGVPASPGTALFTATSAVCVTGLIVEDTGTYWSRGGQLVILVLIQLGGVGLMTFAAFFALILGRGLALRERVVLRDVLSEELAHRTGRLVGAILGVTAAFELLGAALLFGMWSGEGLPLADRIYLSVFHSVSAFCNAGFSLFRTSFTAYADRWEMAVVVPALIVLGGLGFSVLVNIWQVGWARLRRRLKGAGAGPQRLSLQSVLVLSTTAILLVGGTGLFLVFERNGALEGLTPAAALKRAFFQSVTARTAGFNTVPIGATALPTACILMVWMFIGASPGSTGGGIKTSTVAVVMANLWAMLRRRERVEALRRTIPAEIVNRALAVVSLAVITVAVLIVLLAVTEGRRFPFEDICFEAFSAFGTVGLSRGITPHLSAAGRLVVVAGMFVGRIGPLTLAVALTGRAQAGRYEYPEESVMIG